ncbi:MAG TPA: response regulator transcription factor [Cyclobacteriaceae bacterium]
MNITCLIVDDEPLARNLLKEYVNKVPYLDLKGTCSNAIEAMELMRRHPVDLLLLDIQMPDITGTTFVKTLQRKPLVIFTTAYSDYALESYDLDVVDYLLKPITFERFLRAIDKVGQRVTSVTAVAAVKPTQGEAESSFIFVKDGTKLVKVRWEDILYIEGLKDYVTIHTREKKIVTLQRLKTLETQLPANKFIRIHNSYIVALGAIDVIHKNDVQVGKTLLPISDTYRRAFREFIEKNHLK